jgi:hypothetical protein
MGALGRVETLHMDKPQGGPHRNVKTFFVGGPVNRAVPKGTSVITGLVSCDFSFVSTPHALKLVCEAY